MRPVVFEGAEVKPMDTPREENVSQRVLVVEDDEVSRRVLTGFLRRWGYEVVTAASGDEAWELLQLPAAPQLIVLDWMMPGLGGLELVRKIREANHPSPAYILMLTARADSKDIVEGLEAGADDYLTKPFNHPELRARIAGGARVVTLQRVLGERVRELETSLARVKTLQGLLPICSYCKRIRDDRNYWQQVEQYISEHSEVEFSHGICPTCYEKIVAPELKASQPSHENS